MSQSIHTYIGTNAVAELVTYCQNLPTEVFTLVADRNTFNALGQRVTEAFKAANLQLTTIVLDGEEIIADERYLMQVFLRAPIGPQVFLAVGSGTITDITRYVSYRTDNTFISVPTAPSVDGFISLGAPLVVNGLKDTFTTQAPQAVFADSEVLSQAPSALIAAGFGDILGKLTSLADWELESLLWDGPFDTAIAGRVRGALQQCVDAVDAIAARSPEGINHLTEALLESGRCMLKLGNSRPASGAEHHCSHYWEMKLLEQQRPALLHGAKVGYATSLIASQYATVRDLSRDAMIDQLEGAEWPSKATQIAEIEQAYGAIAPDIIAIQQPFLDMSPQTLEQIRQRVVENWDTVQKIAATIPTPEEIRTLLQRVHGPTTREELSLEQNMIDDALRYGHYLRRRFTVMKLLKVLDIPPTQ